MLPLFTLTPLSYSTVPLTLRWGGCASIQYVLQITMIKQANVRVENGAGTKPSPTTKMARRLLLRTATYRQPNNF